MKSESDRLLGLSEEFIELIITMTNSEDLEDALKKIGQGMITYENHHDDDLEGFVKAYENSIMSGHGIIMVAHSQGNLFAIEAYNELADWQKEYFYHISIASPAPATAGSVPQEWITSFDNDIINKLPMTVGPHLTNPVR